MRSSAYRTSRAALLRAVPHPPQPSHPWPDLTDETATAVGDWLEWLADVWRDEDVAEAITYASRDLAAQVGTVLSASAPPPRRVRAT
ncbi:MAG: hypothetical protein ACRDTT_22935, partial [Pseudonocardiaceae bacterium]